MTYKNNDTDNNNNNNSNLLKTSQILKEAQKHGELIAQNW